MDLTIIAKVTAPTLPDPAELAELIPDAFAPVAGGDSAAIVVASVVVEVVPTMYSSPGPGATPAPPPAARYLASVSPATGPEAGGTELTLTGGGLTGIGGVRFEGATTEWAASFVVVDDNTVTCPTPPGTGLVDVIAFNGDPGDAALAAAFTYEP